MKATMACLLLCALLLITAASLAEGESAALTHWPAPEGIAPSADTSVSVNGEALFVYETAVNNNRAYTEYPSLDSTPVALFDMGAPVTVEIRREGVETAIVRPLALGIIPEIEGDTVRFTLEEPAFLTIEFNGETQRALHLFASAPETDVPSPDDPNVFYFGPGIHERPLVRLRSGQSIYLAGGAVLRSKIVADKAEDIRVYGRGIIDGSIYDRWTQRMVPIDFNLCNNVRIEGITILDPAGWTVNTFACDGVSIENIKIIGARANSDGFTAQSCSNYLAQNCFVRGWDDNLVVKNYGNGISHDITFRDIILWTDLAQSCEIGYETRGPEIYNITFENITVLHNFHKPVMSIHNSDQAHVHDIWFRNVVVEDAQMGQGDGENWLIDLTIAESGFSQSQERGRTSDIHFEGITVLGGQFPASRFMGFDADHAIDTVTIEGLNILGQSITTPQDGRFSIHSFAQGIEILQGQ
ncbi:MAG: hypothetical protein LBN04_06155 [Oscillospiraceae bacterium]|jgi:hypothetical protein|nr:hypothetical protein [Oscillospiraceae bacterium]